VFTESFIEEFMVKLWIKKNGRYITVCFSWLFSFIPAPKFTKILQNHIMIRKKFMIPNEPIVQKDTSRTHARMHACAHTHTHTHTYHTIHIYNMHVHKDAQACNLWLAKWLRKRDLLSKMKRLKTGLTGDNPPTVKGES